MRIISLAPSNTEILYSLGVQDDVIAVTRFCDYPAAALQKKRVGGWLDADLQEVITLQPDLVVTSTFLQDKAAATLRAAGLEVVHVDPKTLDDVYASILTIGDAVGKTREAHAVVDTMTRGFDVIKADAPLVPVYIEEWHRPPTVSGNWVPDVLAIAGGLNFLIQPGERSAEVSAELLKQLNPELIVLSWCGFGVKARVDWVVARDSYASLPAVKNGALHVMDDSLLNRPGPRLLQGAQELHRLISLCR